MLRYNYSQIIEKDGKPYLFDAELFQKKVNAISLIDNIFVEARGWLKVNEYPETLEYIAGVVLDPDFLRRKTVEETEATSRRLKLPRHIAKIHKAAAENAVDELDTTRLEELRRQLFQMQQDLGLNIDRARLYFDKAEGVKVERGVVEEELQRSCLRAIPDEVTEYCAAIKEMLLKLRQFDDKGFPVLDTVSHFLGNYLAPHLRPDLDSPKLCAYVVTNMRQTRLYMRTCNREQFFLHGGAETDEERAKHGQTEGE